MKLFLVSIPLGEVISCFHSLGWSYFLFPFLWVKLFLVSIPLSEVISCFHSLGWSYFLFPFLWVKLFLVSIPFGEIISCFHSLGWSYFFFPSLYVNFFQHWPTPDLFCAARFSLFPVFCCVAKNRKNLWIPEIFFVKILIFSKKIDSPLSYTDRQLCCKSVHCPEPATWRRGTLAPWPPCLFSLKIGDRSSAKI